MSEDSNGSKEQAQALSRDCPHCSGNGQLMVFWPGYRGLRVEDRECLTRGGEVITRPWPMIVAAHCICLMGRWMRAKTEPELLPRIPDLADILAGRSRWLARDPMGDTPCNSPAPSLDRMKETVGRHVGTRGGRT